MFLVFPILLLAIILFLASLIFLRLVPAVLFSAGVVLAGVIALFPGVWIGMALSARMTEYSQEKGLFEDHVAIGCGFLVACAAGIVIWRALPDVDKRFFRKSRN